MKERKIKSSIYLPEALHKEVVSLLHKRGRSMNHLVVEAIRYIISREKVRIRISRDIAPTLEQEPIKDKSKYPEVSADDLFN